MKSSFCIDLQRFMLIPTKFPLIPFTPLHRSTFGRLPEQEGEGKAAQARRGGGASAGGRGTETTVLL